MITVLMRSCLLLIDLYNSIGIKYYCRNAAGIEGLNPLGMSLLCFPGSFIGVFHVQEDVVIELKDILAD